MKEDESKIDTSIFKRLDRLFSTDVIIRNVGGKQLKTIDINKIQSIGNLRTNVATERYNRIWNTGGYNMGLNPHFNYPMTRMNMYADYELMDNEAIVATVLDIIGEESTLKNPDGNILTITSSNEAIERELHRLFYDILNIEFNLYGWVRNTAKYGDCFLHLTLVENFGIQTVMPLSVYNTEREEGYDPLNRSAVRFRSMDSGAGIGFSSTTNNERYFKNFEIAHFRMIGDSNYLPYGKSYLEPARRTYKQYVLLKDALILHQIMRAPEKRIFNVDVGNLPPNEIEPFIKNFMATIKKTPFMDPNTGDYNMKYNLQNGLEDFILPRRGTSSGTTIETTPGLTNQGATDVVEFLRSELFAAFKVPKSFMGYEADVSGKSTLSAQDIRFSRTIERIQRIILSELTKMALIHLYMLGYNNEELTNFDLKLYAPSIVYEQEKINLLNEKTAAAQSMFDSGLFSSDYIYETIFDMSEEKYRAMREGILADKKRTFRLAQVENEGNDPNISGKSFGTPHDLAIMQGLGRESSGEVPEGYDETNPEGRPKEHASNYGTQYNAFGRDPIGKDTTINQSTVKSYKPEFNGNSPLSLKENRQQKRRSLANEIFDKNRSLLESLSNPDNFVDESNLLSEDNIMNL